MERVAEEEFYDNLPGFELIRKAAEAGLIGVCGGTECELRPEFLRQAAFQANNGLIADLVFAGE